MNVKVIAVSDLHGHLPPIEPCDLLLLAGDLCPANDHSTFAQIKFLAGPFAEWLERTPAQQIIGIAGNHDFLFQKRPDLVPRSLRWHYLQDAATDLNGLKIYGTPWQPRFYDWAFNLDEEQLVKKWAMVPDDTDILICHGPPLGYGDQPQGPKPPQGSPGLLSRIQQIAPRLVVFGHIHEGRGRWQLQLPRRRDVILANVSHVDLRYAPVHPPMVFEIGTEK